MTLVSQEEQSRCALQIDVLGGRIAVQRDSSEAR